ncbi:MAG: hypothetical protein A3A86_05705 [Elusimicrobia bacterium RIFCSPLOWO2_01_FULL_60_11]|nr:MAG: hypothetical protein A3A86_05705 [Elusimicrobia bacterium RIFCSPLOWO2_01_FULL_60_11]
MKISIVLLLASITLSGCSIKLTALRATADILDTGVTALYEETDAAYARESMAGHLKLMEALLKNDPKNKKILLNLARGFGGYAFLFIEDEDPARARYFYRKGWDYGRRLLSAGADDAPALFWTAYCWGGWASLSLDDPEAVADLPKVEALVKKAEELRPGYFYGGPDLLLGATYASRPKMFGGDLKRSEGYFENAVKNSSGKFLMARFLYAKYQAVPAQDREKFRSLLESVISAPDGLLPEQGLSNKIAKEKAKKLLKKIDELF